MSERPIEIPAGDALLPGGLVTPPGATGVVVFAHGSGSSRHSPRNRQVAAELQERGLATLLFDLLTPEEEDVDMRTAHLRFDIPMLADRLVAAIDHLGSLDVGALPVGTFGASTGAAAALVTAARRPDVVRAVVSRGGRPDLAADSLPHVEAPTLLIVGGRDDVVIEMNKDAMRRMKAEVSLVIVPSATHLFEEPGALEEVSRLGVDWFDRHLTSG